MDKFLKIAITLPDAVEDENVRISNLLETGFDFVHIRKPYWDKNQTEDFIRNLPSEYYSRLILHNHHALASQYKLGGVHLNARNANRVDELPFSVSCHNLDELDLYPDAHYKFLSPIFDSISKPGYKSRFQIAEIRELIKGKNVVALGGVTLDKLSFLEGYGFIGAALMGALW